MFVSVLSCGHVNGDFGHGDPINPVLETMNGLSHLLGGKRSADAFKGDSLEILFGEDVDGR